MTPLLRRLLPVGAALALFLATLATLQSPAEASGFPLTVSRSKAIVGQWLVFQGRVPGGGVHRVELERTLYHVVKASGQSGKDGRFTLRLRMMSMPREGFRVHVAGGPTSKTVYVTGIHQETRLTGRGGDLTATVEPAMARRVALQKRTSPTGWTTVDTRTTSGGGSVNFSVPIGGIYRALALPKGDILSSYSPAYVTAYPHLSSDPSSLAAPSGSYHPQPDSGNSAAAKFGWWPASLTWDWEYATGMEEWTNYSEGTGRANLSFGGLWLQSGLPRSDYPSYGSVSSTYQKKGFSTGDWEMRSKFVQKAPAFTPYTARYSLVPEGTPDGSRPSVEVLVAQHTGYGTKTLVGLRDGESEYTKTLTSWKHNPVNWHAYALQLTDSRITWIINGKAVASMARPAGLKGNLVPRVELVAPANSRMTYTNMNTDWIRYFQLKDGPGVSGPSGGFTSTPLPRPKTQVEPPEKPKQWGRLAQDSHRVSLSVASH